MHRGGDGVEKVVRGERGGEERDGRERGDEGENRKTETWRVEREAERAG